MSHDETSAGGRAVFGHAASSGPSPAGAAAVPDARAPASNVLPLPGAAAVCVKQRPGRSAVSGSIVRMPRQTVKATKAGPAPHAPAEHAPAGASHDTRPPAEQLASLERAEFDCRSLLGHFADKGDHATVHRFALILRVIRQQQRALRAALATASQPLQPQPPLQLVEPRAATHRATPQSAPGLARGEQLAELHEALRVFVPRVAISAAFGHAELTSRYTDIVKSLRALQRALSVEAAQ